MYFHIHYSDKGLMYSKAESKWFVDQINRIRLLNKNFIETFPHFNNSEMRFKEDFASYLAIM